MADEENRDEVAEITPFDPTKKKKKKKVVIQDPGDDSADKLAEKTEALSVFDGLDFTSMKKKKKKPVETSFLNEESGDERDDADDHIDGDEENDGIVLEKYPWTGTDPHGSFESLLLFCYELVMVAATLLGRVFNILRENNPELAGDRHRTVMRPPQVLHEGTKKTVFPDHVMAFLLTELGTSGSLDGQQRLVVKDEYVICLGWKSPDTFLSKENRLFFLRCEKCGSGRSVAPIKAGFVARVGRMNAGT
ncbi:Translation initiation factor IF2/IF5 [Corchorus olitorius]|uniref:Translation initiation factor IF2/IF5 n=1 Tax=Corchorus olitorius TaxID=93759 RepID=A0A1R3GME4_9ROSI|nr:Translation initiation factor IF2/IF5 [Corchorus olitorius]